MTQQVDPLPEPPYPPETRTRGWRFELDMERARQSDTWALAPAEARPWLLMMWATAWEQVPAGSMAADDQLICAHIGMPPRLFAKHREVLMRRWWKAADGRLYHDVLVQRVNEMMEKRRAETERKAVWRAKREAERRGGDAKEAGTDGGQPGTGAGVTSDEQSVPVVSHGTDAGQTRESPGIDDTRTSTRTRTRLKENTEDLSGVADATPSSAEPTRGPPAKPRPKPTIPCPYDDIVSAYHAALPSLPRVRMQTDARHRAMRKLWGWVLSSAKPDGSPRATDGSSAMAWVSAYFARAADNDWLMGRTPRPPEHAGWRADFDFLLTERGMQIVIERTEARAA